MGFSTDSVFCILEPPISHGQSISLKSFFLGRNLDGIEVFRLFRVTNSKKWLTKYKISYNTRKLRASVKPLYPTEPAVVITKPSSTKTYLHYNSFSFFFSKFFT